MSCPNIILDLSPFYHLQCDFTGQLWCLADGEKVMLLSSFTKLCIKDIKIISMFIVSAQGQGKKSS